MADNPKKARLKGGSGVFVLRRLISPWKERFQTLGQMAMTHRLPLCVVGGCVRDLFLDKIPLDWDVVVQGPATAFVQDAAKHFSAGVVHYPAFLTYTLTFSDETSLDIATARSESYSHPAALPVVEPATLTEDFLRRDFTVNAMAIHLTPDRWGRLEDPFDGFSDMRRRFVRILHDNSFIDDPTRIYRAARYAGRYGWRLEKKTLKRLLDAVQKRYPARLSPARLRNELERLLKEKDPRSAFRMLWKWGAWMFWSHGWTWNPFVACALSPTAFPLTDAQTLAFRLMTLCRFRSAHQSKTDLRRLEFPGDLCESVSLALQILDSLERDKVDGGNVPERHSVPIRSFLRLALKNREQIRRWEISSPFLNGVDLQNLGYFPGPIFKKIFESLRKARWHGRVSSRGDEVRHVIDNFPRKN